MRLRWIWLTITLLLWPLAPGVHAQGSRKDDLVLNARGLPLAGATVRVCAMPAAGQPCTPLALIYSDAALTQALANPTATDGLGNYYFYAAPGKYMIEISGSGITTRQMPNVILPSDPTAPSFSSLSSTGGISAFSLNLGGNLTVNGNATVVGALAGGTMNLANQGAAPGAPSAGTVNLYTKSADKRLYYKDDSGTEVGPVSGGGASTGAPNTWTAAQNFDANVANKGPNPWYDITRYGARAVNPAPTTTATMSAGSAAATLAGTSTFQNGDGVVVYGAGATNTLATPGAPTVTPSQDAGPTGIGVVVSSAAAATTYNYQVVAVTKNGAVTAASAVGTTATGATALGDNSVSITSIARSNNTSTVTCAATCSVAVGAIVYVSGTTDTTFTGFFVVASVISGTQFTFTQGYDTRAGASTSATGGTLHWYVCNHVTWTAVTNAWKYYIYGRTGGALALIGVTKVLDPVWDDYGATMEGGTTFPSWVPATPPVSATNEWLSTTIVSGAGTTSVTLANAATNSVAGATFLFDDAPAILAAANAAVAGASYANGTLRIPAPATPSTYYYVNSYLTLPAAVTSVEQNGALAVNETIQISGGLNWTGARGGTLTLPTFAFAATQQINGYGNPLIYNTNGSGIHFDSVYFAGVMGNQQNLMLLDIATNFSCNYCAFVSGNSNNDYMGIGFIVRGDFSFVFRNSVISGGSPFAVGSTLTPGALFRKRIGDGTSGGNFLFENCWVTARGIAQDYTGATSGGNFVQLKYVQAQSLRTPLLMYSGQNFTGQTYLEGVTPADFAAPVVANWSNQQGVQVVNSTGPAGNVGFVTGNLIPALSFFNSAVTATNAGQNREVLINTESAQMNGGPFSSGNPAVVGNFEMRQQMHFPTGNTLFWDGAQMAAPTCAVAAGGSVTVGTWQYFVSPIWQDGGEGILSPASSSCTTSSGNQTINVSWTALTGATGYNLYRGNPGSGSARVNQGPCTGPQFTTTSFSDTFSFTCGTTAPTVAGGGPTSLNQAHVITPQVIIAGETVSAAPRGEENAFLPGALTATWTGATWTIDKAITVTRVEAQAKTAPAGCTTNAVVRVTDGTTPVNVTLSAATNSSGAISQNYAAGAALTIGASTAASGCTTSPADVNVTVQYKMQ
ncbi:MAG: hypothetical protein LAN84_06450 [Acidobacteriia bacterium]|nr:hypothetical protein [Terriglobia bacterium]